jgi:Mg2+-importing ATPase
MLYVRSIEQEGVREAAALACMAVATFSYYSAYALCLIVALVVADLEGHLNPGVITVAVLFMLISMAFSILVLKEVGRQPGRISAKLERVPLIRGVIQHLREADPKLAQSRGVLARAIGWQVVIVLLDSSSIWCLLRAVGADPAPQTVYASYMFSSLFRTLGILPGGLGTFEAASVLLLATVGVPAAAGLSATLLFRGISFWLPMLPGMFIARRLASRD